MADPDHSNFREEKKLNQYAVVRTIRRFENRIKITVFDKGREVQLWPGSNNRQFPETRVRELEITVQSDK